MNEGDRLTELIRVSLMKHVGKSCSLAENIAADLIASGVTIMSGWISVEERLPEDDCYVLCVSASAEGVKRIGVRFFTRNAVKPNGDFFLDQELYLIVVGDKITHWMPLPKPPEATS